MGSTFSSLDVQTFLIFGVTFLLCHYLTRRPTGLPPGPWPWPVVGNLVQLGNPQKMHLTLHKLYQKYGGLYTLWFGPFQSLVLSDLPIIKEALLEKSEVFSDRPTWMYMFQRYTKDIGVVFNSGHIWREMRRFTATALRDFGVGKKSIEEKIQTEAEYLCHEVAQHAGKPQSFSVMFQQAVSNIINSICFGDRFEYDDAEFKEMLHAFDVLFKENAFASPVNFWPFLRHLPGDLFHIGLIDKYDIEVKSFMDRLIEKQKATFDPKQIRHFIDLYLLKEQEGHEEGDTFSRSSMQRTLFDLFAAGTETTSTSLRWFLLYMVNRPRVQDKCFEEISKVVGDSRTPALSDRANLPYMEATLYELLRHANVGPFTIPHDTKKATSLCGYHIPAHTLVFVNLYSVHMNPQIWHDPEQFNPERWIKDGKVQQNKEGFIPFSLGARACLGESLAKNELFIFATTLLQRFRFMSQTEGILASMEGAGDVGLTLAPPEYQVIAEPR